MGEKRWSALEKQKKAGKKLSPLDERPPPPSKAFEDVWQAWLDLAPRRASGMVGPSPIQFSEIRAWLDEHGVTGPSRRLFFDLLLRLDAVDLKHAASSTPSPPKSSSSLKPTPGGKHTEVKRTTVYGSQAQGGAQGS